MPKIAQTRAIVKEKAIAVEIPHVDYQEGRN